MKVLMILLMLAPSVWADVDCDGKEKRKEGVSEEGHRAEWCELNGKKHGEYLEWFKNGKKRIESNFKRGVREGKHTVWYENGEKAREGKFKKDILDGKWTRWYENGRKKDRGKWHKGKPQGTWQKWHKTGKTQSKGSFKNGEPVGNWKFFYPNGKRKSRGDFEKGKKVCEWEYWDESGNHKVKKEKERAAGCKVYSSYGRRSWVRNNISLAYQTTKDFNSFPVKGLLAAWSPTKQIWGDWLYLNFSLGLFYATSTGRDGEKYVGPLVELAFIFHPWAGLLLGPGGGAQIWGKHGLASGGFLMVGWRFDRPLFGFLERLYLKTGEVTPPTPDDGQVVQFTTVEKGSEPYTQIGIGISL